MTSKEMIDSALSRADAAWKTIRDQLADPTHFNDESKEHKRGMEELHFAIEKVFKVKNLVAECEKMHDLYGKAE